MKLLSWILFWIFFIQAVSGLNIFEVFLKDFLVDLIRGPKPPRYLADFPRCGKTGRVIDVPGTQGCSCDKKCGYGEGRCSGDSECQDDLICGKDNCRSSIFPNGESAKDGWDCCTIDQNPAVQPNVTSFTNTTIVSPMYPDLYNNSADVTWTITTTSGFIKMKIHFFELEDTCSCSSDKVEIVTNGQRRYLKCGRLEVPWNRTFSGPTLEIRFKSDGSVSKRGFLATFQCGSGTRQCLTSNTIKTIQTIQTATSLEKSSVPFSVFSEMPQTNGTCSSPNYPQNYSGSYNENVVCSIMASDSANYIEIVFLDIAIEAPNYQVPTECQSLDIDPDFGDWVRIEEVLLDGTRTSLLNRSCGYTLPSRIPSTPGSTVSVYFRSDSEQNLRGFYLVWGEIRTPAVITEIPTPLPTTPRNCSRLTGSQDDLDCCTQQNPCGYKEGDCDNDDECQGNYRCGQNNCRVYDPNAYALSDCCVFPHEFVLQASSSTVRPVVLKRGVFSVIQQFSTITRAITTTTPIPPTTKLPPTVKTVVQVPPNKATILSHVQYGRTVYEPNLSKAWEIQVTGQFHIQLKFTGKFDIRPDKKNGCSSEWVRVFDGNTELLPKTCNMNAKLDKNMQSNLKIPVSNSNKVTVYFKTNRDKNEGTGFNLTREIVPAFFRNSPSLPTVASSDECLLNCTWKENPFYGVNVIWESRNVSTPGFGDIIIIPITLPQIPNNLNCLQNCFPKADSEEVRKICESRGDLDNIECLLYKGSRLAPDEDGIISNRLDNPDGKKKKRKRRQIINPPNEDESFIGRYFIPTSPPDIALAYCILADMDRRGRLPALGSSTDKFYTGEYLFDRQNCSAFFPKTFPRTVADQDDDRNFGPSSSNVERGDKDTSVYPWMCSLKETGFRGRHKCGVTLISGKSAKDGLEDAPTIFVGAAHCNFVCKDLNQRTLETCCCRKNTDPTSCRSDSQSPSSYCPAKDEAFLVAAKNEDLKIVCNLYNIDVIPEKVTKEEEIVITITKISNHPSYSPGFPENIGANQKGPYAGNDISVYHVDDSEMKLEEGKLWPACLPRDEEPSRDHTSPSQDFFAGWLDAEPYYRLQKDTSVDTFRESYLRPRKTQMTNVECKDPAWMRSHSFYPAGTLCFKDPSESSCYQFGNSGSSVMTHFTEDGESRFAFAGPLSMHKGCDQTRQLNEEFVYASKNPGVITDARCHLGWIAQEYGFSIPGGYTVPESCRQSKGRREDIDQAVCRVQTNITSFCDWTQKDKTRVWDRCILASDEGFSYNIYQCRDSRGQLGTCSNNCRGVDPNAIIIGGTAVLAASGIAVQTALQLGLGLAAIPAAPAIGMGASMLMTGCPPGQCLARNARRPRQRKCCPLRGGRRPCPVRC